MPTTTAEILSDEFTLDFTPIRINWDTPYVMPGINTKFYTISLAEQNTPLYIKYMSEVHQGRIKPPRERRFFSAALQIFKNTKYGPSSLFTTLEHIKNYFENEIKKRVKNGQMQEPKKIFTPFQYGNDTGKFPTPLVRLKINFAKTQFAKLVLGKPQKINVTNENIHQYITSLSEHDGFVKISVCEHSYGITLKAEVTVDCISKTYKEPYFGEIYEDQDEEVLSPPGP